MSQAPNKTDGMENGTNHRKICRLMCFLKTTIRETELATVPVVSVNGTTEAGSMRFRTGIRTRLAPPPQMALIQNAATAPKNRRMILKTMIHGHGMPGNTAYFKDNGFTSPLGVSNINSLDGVLPAFLVSMRHTTSYITWITGSRITGLMTKSNSLSNTGW